MNENTNGAPPFAPDYDLITSLEAGRDVPALLCWVCEEKVSKPAHFRDRRGDVRIVHDWCVAGATTKDRRLFVEGG